MGRYFAWLALITMSKIALGLNLDETQNHNFISQLSVESQARVAEISSLYGAMVSNLSHSESSASPHMNITKDDEPTINNGNIGGVKDTQMQINPNGVN